MALKKTCMYCSRKYYVSVFYKEATYVCPDCRKDIKDFLEGEKNANTQKKKTKPKNEASRIGNHFY